MHFGKFNFPLLDYFAGNNLQDKYLIFSFIYSFGNLLFAYFMPLFSRCGFFLFVSLRLSTFLLRVRVCVCIHTHTHTHTHTDTHARTHAHTHADIYLWSSLSLSRHPSLSSIAFGRTSRLHPVSIQARFILSLFWSANIGESLCRSSLEFSSAQHFFFPILGWFIRWEISGCTAAIMWLALSRICSKQRITFLFCSHLNFFSIYFVRIQEVHLYSSTDTIAAWKKSCYILSERPDFHMIGTC